MNEAWLLDSSVLIALSDGSHTAHELARRWFKQNTTPFATTPITQGALLRYHLRIKLALEYADAIRILGRLSADSRHRFLPDDLPYDAVPANGIRGHRQVTDAYLAALARHHGLRLLTLDEGQARSHSDVAEMIH